MAIVNFSVPPEVEVAFRQAFAGENKSAIVARLMRQAVEERQRAQRRAAAVRKLLKLRRRQAPVAASAVRNGRRSGRS